MFVNLAMKDCRLHCNRNKVEKWWLERGAQTTSHTQRAFSFAEPYLCDTPS
jgi:hypothetical protein